MQVFGHSCGNEIRQLQHRPRACAVWCSVNSQLWSFCGSSSIPGSTKEKQDPFGIFSATCWISCCCCWVLLHSFTQGLWSPWCTESMVAASSCCLACVCIEPRGAGCRQWSQDSSAILVPVPECSHCPSLQTCQQWFQQDVHPPDVAGWFTCPWKGLGSFWPVCRAHCLPWLCLWKSSKPSGAAAHAFWAWCGLTSNVLCWHCHPRAAHVCGVCHCSLSLNKAGLFCALPASSGARLGVKVKLQHPRIDFSEPHQGDMLIARLGIFLHVSPHKHTLIKYSLEHKKCFP